MADKKKLARLRKHAEKANLEVDEVLSSRLSLILSDEKINIRVPGELKEALMEIAASKKIPYQRYIKSVLIEAVAREKAS